MLRSVKFALMLAFPLSLGCTEAERGTEGAACPSDNNCLLPLRCVSGICSKVAEAPDTGLLEDSGVGPLDAAELAPDAGEIPSPRFNSGTFSTTTDGTGLGFTISGRAALIVEPTGYTSVMITASGLTPNTQHGAHVHAKACADEGGGPHYKLDPAREDQAEANELWPAITTDAAGSGRGLVRVMHGARPDAKSVVIHAPGVATRIACADLLPNVEVQSGGSFSELPDGVGLGFSGTAQLLRRGTGTEVNVSLSGPLEAGKTYATHVHASPCATESGGPHYKIDPGVMAAEEGNELWPNVTMTGPNAGMGTKTTTHIARFEAQSVVVHHPDTAKRLLCADLVW
ncbi:MAG: hypothetical protein HY791_04605 [Deltaproteobacteria bacterium]|nr:hypothetical protein [Deltaproteobacteria bacterium]